MEFIDDERDVQNQGPSGYCLMNVTSSLQGAMQDKSIAQELNLENPENFVSDYVDKIEHKFHEVEGLEKRIQKFKQQLKILEEESKDSFYFSIFYAVYYSLLEEEFSIFVKIIKNLITSKQIGSDQCF